MVLKLAYAFLAGVGVASFPMHFYMRVTQRMEMEDIHEEFRRKRDLLFLLKMYEMSEDK